MSHKAERHKRAKNHQNWTVEDWKKVVWSDKTKINILGSDSVRYCYSDAKNCCNVCHFMKFILIFSESIGQYHINVYHSTDLLLSYLTYILCIELVKY